jgi:excisionase family DNA binding protein
MELTASQAAARLGASRDWVNRMCRSGRLAGARRIGHLWVVPEEALEGVTAPRPGRPRKAADDGAAGDAAPEADGDG